MITVHPQSGQKKTGNRSFTWTKNILILYLHTVVVFSIWTCYPSPKLINFTLQWPSFQSDQYHFHTVFPGRSAVCLPKLDLTLQVSQYVNAVSTGVENTDIMTGVGNNLIENMNVSVWLWHRMISEIWQEAEYWSMERTNEAQLRELQDHPVLWRELQGKVLHGGKVVGLGHDVILQLTEQVWRKNTV